ncbi:MAG: 16S rRNA (guanine(527)-N(7))-methyltransferase RsmG [Gammaproteobacteria bacterium]
MKKHFELLQSGLEILGLEVPSLSLNKFTRYIELIEKWNKIFSLTAAKNREEIVIKHILDSLSIAKYIKGPEILDFGSGAGFPGIPLAILLSEYHFTLLDSLSKKTRFLQTVVVELKLANVTIVNERCENFFPKKNFSDIVTRATCDLNVLMGILRRLITPDTQVLAMQGKYPEEELSRLSDPCRVIQLEVPYLEAARHLVCIEGRK